MPQDPKELVVNPPAAAHQSCSGLHPPIYFDLASVLEAQSTHSSMSGRKRGAVAMSASAAAVVAPYFASILPSPPVKPATRQDPQGFTRTGSIVRVKMINFMIYTCEEMYPGPGLNLLLGPNGSGKSTCVSAIGIALAGETKSVGRFDRLGEYVKRGCDEAMVEVELFGPPGGKNMIVRRSFSAGGSDKSKFVMDGKPSSKKIVQDAMLKLNIQVNNLCVYLAQFRVGLFAEMNPEEMLEETQKAADLTLYNRHISMKTQSTDLQKKRDTIVQSQKVFDALALEVKEMEGVRRAQEEREMAMEKIANLRHLKSWAQHSQLVKKVHEAEAKKDERKKKMDDEHLREAPIRKELLEHKSAESAARKRKEEWIAKHETSRRHHALQLKAIDACEGQLDTVQHRLKDLDESVASRELALSKERETFSLLQRNFKVTREEALIRSERDANNAARMNLRKVVLLHNSTTNALAVATQDALGRVSRAESRLHVIKSRPVVGPLQKLLRADRSRGNKATIDSDQQLIRGLKEKGKLKSEVHGPLMSTLKVDDPQAAIYVESVVGKWASAWVVDNQHDLKALHDAGVKGNLIRSDPNAPVRPRPFNLAPLRQHGLHWLDELIDCAPVVRTALRDVLSMGSLVCTSQILSGEVCNQIISRKKGDNRLQNLFTPTQNYSSKSSQWTDDVAVSVENIDRKAARFLGGSAVDSSLIEELRFAEEELAAAVAEHRAAEAAQQACHREWNSNAKDRDAATKQLNEESATLEAEFNRRRTLATSMDHSQDKIAKLERHKDNPREKDAMVKEIAALEKQLIQLKDKLQSAEWSSEDAAALNAARSEASEAYAALQQKQLEVDSISVRHQQLRSAFEEAEKQVFLAKKAAADQKEIAKRGCAKEILDALMWIQELKEAHGEITVEIIDAKTHELTNALKRGIDNASIADRYNAKKLELDEREAELEAAKLNIQHAQEKISELTDKWKAGIEKMVKTIDKHFAAYFRTIGATGGVELQTEVKQGEPKFGIVIKVSFRKGEPMRPLSGASQSGGEKSVSTMLYLLCLQEVTNTPFRMADEINQGMDATNERHIFNQIVKSCEDKRNDEQGNVLEPPQYFVVTPKLLPNLRYTNRVTVFNVYNGPFMLDQTEFDLDQFLRMARSEGLEEAKKIKKRRIEEERRHDMRLTGSQMAGSQISASQME